MNIKDINIGDWVSISNSVTLYQVTGVNEEFNYVTVLMNRQSKIVLAKQVTSIGSVPTESRDVLKAIMQRVDALTKRFEQLSLELASVESSIIQMQKQWKD